MEELYWSGYTLAFILEIISIIIAYIQKKSIRAKNFSKVGLYYSLSQGNFVEGSKPGFFSNFLGIVFRLLINPLLSWIMVFIRGYGFVSLINQKISTPEKLKEIQYKLGASLLSEEEIKILIRESASFMGKDVNFEDSEEDNILILEDSEGGWYFEIRLDTNNQKAYFYSHSPDYDSEFNDISEYKIEGNKIYLKLIEKKTSHPGQENYFEIKNGVVLESSIKDEYKNNKFAGLSSTLEEKIKELKDSTNWQKNNNYKIRYFILSKHSEIISTEELNKFFRQELERIKLGFLEVSALCKKHNIELVFDEEYKSYEFKNKKENEDINYEDFFKKLEKLLKKVKCKRYEIESYNEITETLNNYLGEE